MDCRDEKTQDEKRRTAEELVRSYNELVEQEKTARANGNARHLAACLAGQQKTLRRLKHLGLTGAHAVL